TQRLCLWLQPSVGLRSRCQPQPAGTRAQGRKFTGRALRSHFAAGKTAYRAEASGDFALESVDGAAIDARCGDEAVMPVLRSLQRESMWFRIGAFHFNGS